MMVQWLFCLEKSVVGYVAIDLLMMERMEGMLIQYIYLWTGRPYQWWGILEMSKYRQPPKKAIRSIVRTVR